jgi:hypothetical protein
MEAKVPIVQSLCSWTYSQTYSSASSGTPIVLPLRSECNTLAIDCLLRSRSMRMTKGCPRPLDAAGDGPVSDSRSANLRIQRSGLLVYVALAVEPEDDLRGWRMPQIRRVPGKVILQKPGHRLSRNDCKLLILDRLRGQSCVAIMCAKSLNTNMEQISSTNKNALCMAHEWSSRRHTTGSSGASSERN